MKCIIVGCFVLTLAVMIRAVPHISTHDIVKQTAQLAQKKHSLSKKSIRNGSITDRQAEVLAFMETDLNGNGHITASEWATYYVNLDHEDLPKLSYRTWVRAFNIKMIEPGFDKNYNGQMELGEYLSI